MQTMRISHQRTHGHESRTVLAVLLLVTVLATWIVGGPAAAQPLDPADDGDAQDDAGLDDGDAQDDAGLDDGDEGDHDGDDGDDGDHEDDDPDRPRIEVDVEPACRPEPGFHYDVVLPAPLLVHHVQWRQPGGSINTVFDNSGFVASGEGEFEFRVIVLNPATGRFATPWQDLTVRCRPDDTPDPDDEPDPGDIVPGTPNFTG